MWHNTFNLANSGWEVCANKACKQCHTVAARADASSNANGKSCGPKPMATPGKESKDSNESKARKNPTPKTSAQMPKDPVDPGPPKGSQNSHGLRVWSATARVVHPVGLIVADARSVIGEFQARHVLTSDWMILRCEMFEFSVARTSNTKKAMPQAPKLNKPSCLNWLNCNRLDTLFLYSCWFEHYSQ